MKRFIPHLVLGLGLLYLAFALFPAKPAGAFDLQAFGRLPVLMEGRLKPFDTVARTSLLLLQGRQAVVTPDGRTLTPDEWLLDMLFRGDQADHYQDIEIVHPDLLALLGFATEDGAGGKRFSAAQIIPKLDEIEKQDKLAGDTPENARNAFQHAVMTLSSHLSLYFGLRYSLTIPASSDFQADLATYQGGLTAGVAAVRAEQAGQPYDEKAANATLDAVKQFQAMADHGSVLAIPPAEDDPNRDNWRNAGNALLDGVKDRKLDPGVLAYAAMGHAWRAEDATVFNKLVGLNRATLMGKYGERIGKTDTEAAFNAAAPFYHGMVLYVAAFVLAVFSWLRWPDALGRAALWLTGLTWVLATGGILVRMWLEGRPPVTNLYSSALFIGWGAVALCLVLEVIYRDGIGSAAAGLIGFCTLLIAHHLALSGDTMEMMRAVLDSNFWLGTHVVVVTSGYAATYLAGFLALIYVVRGVFTRTLEPATATALTKMVYGIVCFATLFSFVGTVLGGIWADQSWGRFWGWDPKENGALIIVLWNALILHARWGGLVRQRGLMALAIFGNVVTSWSWFGVNMLSVGLHSYGFIDKTFWWLLAFVVSQLAFIALATSPAVKWRSGGRAETAPKQVRGGEPQPLPNAG